MSKKKNGTKSVNPRVPRRLYDAELKRLQIQLVEMQQWVTSVGARVLVIFEGRDAAGKGGAIKRVMQYLNPRHARVVALPQPSERERGQWYFQRYIERLPTAGEIVLMDRSWYNRAGVERVMGYSSEEEYQRFLRQAPVVERLLVEDGIVVIKYWFSVSDEEQQSRFASRLNDPMRRWKLSPTDLESILKWEEYSRAKDDMFAVTDIDEAPWWTIESDDKRAARLNVISHLLSTLPYDRLDPEEVSIPDRPGATDYVRPPRDLFRYAPDIAAELGKKRRSRRNRDSPRRPREA
jgi:polyphosphate kinase 2